MNLIGILVVLLIVWLVNAYTPIPPPLKLVINIVCGLVVLIWLLQLTGLMATFERVKA